MQVFCAALPATYSGVRAAVQYGRLAGGSTNRRDFLKEASAGALGPASRHQCAAGGDGCLAADRLCLGGRTEGDGERRPFHQISDFTSLGL